MKGLVFRKEISLLPGVRLNISKSGISLSLGPKGAHVTSGPRGTFLNLDLHGSGVYYRRKLAAKDGDSDAEKKPEDAPPEVSFLQRLTTAPEELELVDALRALHEEKDQEAYDHARQSV